MATLLVKVLLFSTVLAVVIKGEVRFVPGEVNACKKQESDDMKLITVSKEKNACKVFCSLQSEDGSDSGGGEAQSPKGVACGGGKKCDGEGECKDP